MVAIATLPHYSTYENESEEILFVINMLWRIYCDTTLTLQSVQETVRFESNKGKKSPKTTLKGKQCLHV